MILKKEIQKNQKLSNIKKSKRNATPKVDLRMDSLLKE